jgi:hypothetical protein
MKIIISVLFILLSSSIIAQDTLQIEKELNALRLNSVYADSDSAKRELNNTLLRTVRAFLESDSNFYVSLKNLEFMGDLRSPDGVFRLITWNLALTTNEHIYFCQIQLNPDRYSNSSVIELQDKSYKTERAEFRQLHPEKWYGVLYYDIVPFRLKKKTYYALLGWDGNNQVTKKKVIESMMIDKAGKIRFGYTVFDMGERHKKRRVIFEYAQESYFVLRYDKGMKTIIFNQLAPEKPEYEGIRAFYVPVMQYDGLIYKKNMWKKVENITPKNPKTNKPFNPPR